MILVEKVVKHRLFFRDVALGQCLIMIAGRALLKCATISASGDKACFSRSLPVVQRPRVLPCWQRARRCLLPS